MKAFLLAAGHGLRLRPITDSVPKCMVPIREVPLLSIWLDICKQVGINEVLINLHTHAESVHSFLKQQCSDNIRVRVMVEPQLLGSAGTLRANRDWVSSEDCFWVFYADVLSRANLKDMLKVHTERRPTATLGVYEVPDPSRCGIVTVDGQWTIKEFAEKPLKPIGNLAFSGIMIGTSQALDAIPDSIPADIGFHLLPQLVGRMLAYPISDYLIDIGTMENYQLAQKTWPGLRGE